MKKIIIAMLIWPCSNIVAQKLLIQYLIPNGDEVSTATLIINDTISSFYLDQVSNKKETFFVKNKYFGYCYYSENIMNQVFNIKDSVHNMNWELLSDTAHILNEICQSAKTSFRGRNYIAYYSTKYTVSDGPWKFGGLPGLILLVKSLDNFVEWKAIKIIENYSGSIPKKDLKNISFLNWSEFTYKFKETINNYIKMVRSNGTLSTGATAKLKIESVEIFYPELQTGEGIKF